MKTKKKKSVKGFICGCLTTLMLVGLIGTAAATVGSQTATVDYNDIKVTLDGVPVELVDANGAPAEPFAIDGTTYLPVRAVANALGLGVDWDQATQTVKLSTSGAAAPSTPDAPSTGTTLGEQNALETAQQYLEIMAFSYSGLIGQLEYEGYTTEEATYAADHCGADWNEQAARAAQEYLEVMSFSREGLIDQLEYEGYTTGQAEYGVSQAGY